MYTDKKTIAYSLIGLACILITIMIFVKLNSDEQSAFLCEKFHENQLDMAQCPAHKSNSSWLILSAFGIGIFIFGTGVYLLFIPNITKENNESMKKDFKIIDSSKLDEEEKLIYNILKNKNGSAYQSDLIKETGFSKVKITRILDKLELSEILERKRRGMTNIVVLR